MDLIEVNYDPKGLVTRMTRFRDAIRLGDQDMKDTLLGEIETTKELLEMCGYEDLVKEWED